MAVGTASGAVDRLDVDDRKAKFLGSLGQSRASRSLIFDLVTQRCDLALGAAFGHLGFDLRRYLLVSFLLAGLDLAHLQQRCSEPAFDRRADFARLESKGCVGDGGINDVRFCDHAEIGVRFTYAAFFGDVIELRAFGDALACGGSFFRLWENDLADLALFRLAVAVLVLLKVRLGIGVSHSIWLGDSDGGRDSNVILRYSGARNRALRSSKYLLSTSGVGAGISPACAGPQRHIFDTALFVLKLIECGRRGGGHFHFAGDALGNLPSQQRTALLLDKSAFGESGLTDDLFEALRSNWPLGPRNDGSAVMRFAISASATPSRSFLACSSIVVSATN